MPVCGRRRGVPVEIIISVTLSDKIAASRKASWRFANSAFSAWPGTTYFVFQFGHASLNPTRSETCPLRTPRNLPGSHLADVGHPVGRTALVAAVGGKRREHNRIFRRLGSIKRVSAAGTPEAPSLPGGMATFHLWRNLSTAWCTEESEDIPEKPGPDV